MGSLTDDDDRYFDLDGLARYSGLHPKTLRRYMNDPVNPLPSHHVRGTGKDQGRLLISKREFDAWVHAFPPAGKRRAGKRPVTEEVAAVIRSIKGSS